MMLIEAPSFCIMIGGVLELFSCSNVKITTFELEKTTFVVYLIVLFISMKSKNLIQRLDVWNQNFKIMN
jgi:hypothetical protein